MPPGTTLTPSGSITVSTPGMTVQGLDITGSITVDAPNVTIQDVQLTVTASGSGMMGITVESGATGLQIIDSTLLGASANPSPEAAVFNPSGSVVTLTRVYIYNFADPLEYLVDVTDSYILSNGTYTSPSEGVAHIEDIYTADSTVSVVHSVLFNPWGQTATLFMDTGGGQGGPGDDILTVENSLLAGGGWTMYPSAKSTSVGTGVMTVTGNRFARCLTTPVYDSQSGGTACSGGADDAGYWPGCGYYGPVADAWCPPVAGQSWSANVWDDDGSSVCCDGSTTCP